MFRLLLRITMITILPMSILLAMNDQKGYRRFEGMSSREALQLINEEDGSSNGTQEESHGEEQELEEEQGEDGEAEKTTVKETEEDASEYYEDDEEGDESVAYEEDQPIDSKSSRAKRWAEDTRRDNPHRALYNIYSGGERPKSKLERRKIYELFKEQKRGKKAGNRSADAIAWHLTNSMPKEKEKRKRHNKFVTVANDPRGTMDDFENSPMFDPTIYKSNAWQPDSVEVIQDKRLQDAHRQYRHPKTVSKDVSTNGKKDTRKDRKAKPCKVEKPQVKRGFDHTFNTDY